MKGLLPNIYMADVIDGGRRFRWRLLGSDVITMAGRNATGRFFDELYKAEDYRNFTASFAAVVAAMQPMRSLGSFSFADRSFIHFEALEVPLTQDGAAVDVILGIAAQYTD